MVIRRIHEHVAAHNWFAVAVDFLIVVAGIVIGTQVNNWNQARIERNQGSEYRERLIAELQSTKTHNQNRRAYWQQVRHHAQSALSKLNNSATPHPSLVVDAYQASQILTSQTKRFTYDELISTGRIEHIGDLTLRGEAAGYYLGLEAYDVILNAVPPYRELLRQKMPSRAQQAVRTQCAETIYPGPDGSPYVRLPKACTLRLDREVVQEAVAALASAPEMTGHLNRLIADLDVKLTVLDAVDDHSQRLQSKIEGAQRHAD